MKHLLALFLCLLSFSLAKAQKYQTEENKAKFGVKAGVVFSTLSGGELSNPTLKSGMSIGIYGRWKIGSRFYYQPEINYTERGSKFSNNIDEYNQLKIWYLDANQLLMFKLNKKDDACLVLGIQPSYLMSSAFYVRKDPPQLIAAARTDSINLNRIDYFVSGGLHVNANKVGFQLLAKWGLSNINNGLNTSLKPLQNKSKDIRNFCVELNLVF